MLATDVARRLIDSGLTTMIYTDIRRDGTMSGPNLIALGEMIAIDGAEVVASGGIGSIDDVERWPKPGRPGSSSAGRSTMGVFASRML